MKIKRSDEKCKYAEQCSEWRKWFEKIYERKETFYNSRGQFDRKNFFVIQSLVMSSS